MLKLRSVSFDFISDKEISEKEITKDVHRETRAA